MQSTEIDDRRQDQDIDRLISEILTGRYRLLLEPTNLAEATGECFLRLAPNAADAGVELVNLVPADLEPPRVDPYAVRLMLEGLVLNGIEFTRAGGKVTVTGGGRLPNVWIGVIDTGVGIEPDKLVWRQRSYRHKNDGFSEVERKAAFRLTRARALVELQGGAFEIHSIEGKGTTIMCCLTSQAEAASRR